ncbi:hypothetical protein [Kitasatospora sp. NPDC088346]|uniref:hypothetical protein n=1 Tax=Kitasatospora sp. NPDC088346 TaxID=3364073 RepID=UPI00381BE5A7
MVRLLFQDSDILVLHSPRCNGNADASGNVNRQFGIGDLRPVAWFEWFDNVEVRDPRRGFRR